MGGNRRSDRVVASRVLLPVLCIAVFAALALLLAPHASIRTDRSSPASRSVMFAATAPLSSPAPPTAPAPVPILLPASSSASSPAEVPASSPAPTLTPALASAYPNLIDNGSLEAYYPVTRPRLWHFDPDMLFLWDEFSRGPGDRSLFIDASRIVDLIALHESGADRPLSDGSAPRQPQPRIAADTAPHSNAPSNPSPLPLSPLNIEPPGPRAVLRYSLPSLRPGASYLLSLWLARDRNIDGIYPTAVLGGRTTRLSDFWASGRWQKISLVVTLPRLLPPDQSTLELRIPAGDYRLWIDDLVLRRIEARADIASEQAAPTESAAAAAGPPSTSPGLSRRLLRWTIPSTDRLLDIRIVLSRDRYGRIDARELWTNNAANEDARVPIAKTIYDPLQTTQSPKDEKKDDPSADGVDTFAIPLDALQDFLTAIPAELPATSPARQAGESQPGSHSPSSCSGRWFARVEVYQYRTKLTESNPVSFKLSRQQADGPARASQNESAANAPAANARNGYDALLGSFPIGIYGASLDDFPALREAGFDAVYFSARDAATLTRALSEASRLGLALLTSPPSTAQAALFPSAPAYFYLADEPEGRSVSPKILYKSRAALRRLGLAQPGAIALCRSWRATDYASAVDVFMADPYPIPFEPLAWLSECLDEINRAIAGDSAKRVWAVIQAFPWGIASPQVAPDAGRAPTPAELKALVRLALLHGTDGLFFYALQSGSYRLRDDKPLWQAVKEAIAEARRLKPILDGPDFYDGAARTANYATVATVGPVSIGAASAAGPVLDCPDLDAYGLPAVHFVIKRSPAGTIGTAGASAVDTAAGPGAAPGAVQGTPLVFALNTLDRPVRASLRLPGQATPLTFSLGPHEFVEIARELSR